MEVQHITRKKLVGLTNRVFRKKDKGDVPFADFIELKRCRRGSLDDLEIEYSVNVSSNSSTLVRAGARAGARKNSFRSHKILSPAIHFDVQEPEEMEQNNVELRNEDLEEMNEEESSEVDFSDDLFFLPNTNNFITYIGNNANNNPYDIQAASIHKLIEVLTTPDQKLQNEYKEFVRLFFMTYRSFTSSETVIDLLIRRYKGPKNLNIINQRQKKKLNLNSIREGVCKCLVHWFTTHYHDFSGKPLAKKLQAFIDWVVTNDPPTENNFTGYLSDMYKTKVVKGTYSSLFGSGMLVFKDACPEPILPANWNDVTFLDLNEVEIARQLTVAEYHIYADIQPVELQELAWSSSKLKKLAPRILEMIDRLNKFSYSVSTLIVLTSKLKARKKVVEKFAKIAQGLLEMQNFQSLMAVHSAFQNSGIHRLHHTFNSLTKKSSEIIAHMKELFSPENSFKLYRETLKQCKSPCIPFIGVYLTDLTFIDEGNPQIVNGLVNFRKKQLEADVITQVLKFQKKNYQFQLVPQFAKLYQALPCLEESEVYQKSLEIEPRETKKKDIK